MATWDRVPKHKLLCTFNAKIHNGRLMFGGLLFDFSPHHMVHVHQWFSRLLVVHAVPLYGSSIILISVSCLRIAATFVEQTFTSSQY